MIHAGFPLSVAVGLEEGHVIQERLESTASPRG